MHTLEWVADRPTPYGTAPTWHAGQKRIYWSDLTAGHLHAFDPATGEDRVCFDDGRPIGGITVQDDGALLLFRDQANVVIWRDGRVVKPIIQSIADFRQTHFTSAVAGPGGRVYCATQSDLHHPGRLLCLDVNGRLELIADTFGNPAGMGFSPDQRRFYFNDAHGTHLTTWRFDVNPDTGGLAGQVAFRDSGGLHEPGAPRGLAIDDAGGVWIARWGAGVIQRCEPQGAVVQRVELPVKNPTGLCFGGEHGDRLYLTTSGGHRRQIDGVHARRPTHRRRSGFLIACV